MTYPDELSRRERQVLEIVYRKGSVTAAEVQAELPDRLTNAAVRSLLRILEEKGHLYHREEGPRYVFQPVVPKQEAERGALRGLLATFFDGSVDRAVAALLDLKRDSLTPEDYDRLVSLIEQARKEER
ncbi:MAG: BlaI/MecI/CopY family transcriptional regulator [Bacteroidota bacterium]